MRPRLGRLAGHRLLRLLLLAPLGCALVAVPRAPAAAQGPPPFAGDPCPRAEGRRVAPGFGFALGDGPAYAVGLGPDGVTNYGGAHEEGGWAYVKVLWVARPGHVGPLLVRGERLDEPGELRFGGGADPAAELRLDGGPAGGGAGWRQWPSHARLRGPGCYAFRVAGAGVDQTIVFQAVRERPEELTALPAWGALPRELVVVSAAPAGPGTVRLALGGADGLLVRLDVGPAGDGPVGLPGRDARRLETAAGPVLWDADPGQGWPGVAAWDDGRRRYRLEVLAGAPGGWSQADLVRLVEAFAAAEAPPGRAPASPAPPPP